jgi:hypothetical protein
MNARDMFSIYDENLVIAWVEVRYDDDQRMFRHSIQECNRREIRVDGVLTSMEIRTADQTPHAMIFCDPPMMTSPSAANC